MGPSDQKRDQPVPGYQLVEFLGRGGFGDVWKARAPGGTEVALKIIPLGKKQGRKELKALDLVKRLHHPNLVPITAFWLTTVDGRVLDEAPADPSDRGHFDTPTESVDSPSATLLAPADEAHQLVIAMGLGEMNLFDRLEECKEVASNGIPPDELLGYMEATAQALDFLANPRQGLKHELGSMQHCDIKPQNILIVGGSAQVCDFGLARALGDDRKTTLAASPAYAAPECLLGKLPTTTTDQYSLAISYTELRTGDLPLPNDSIMGAINAHLKGELNLSRLPDDERLVIERATALDPNKRFPSTADMVRALRRAYEGPQESPVPFDVQRSPVASAVFRSSRLVPGAEIVPGYTLVRHVGRGGATDVWEATAPGGMNVGLLIRDLERSRGALDLRALKLIQSFQHQHLVDVHAFWVIDSERAVVENPLRSSDLGAFSKLIVASKLANVSLRQRIETRVLEHASGMTADELLGVMRQVAKALDFLNNANHDLEGRTVAILHGNVRPDNILLFDDTVRIGNFALAQILHETASGIATPPLDLVRPYAAPELVEGRPTRWTDQYALAVTYCCARNGTLATESVTADSLLHGSSHQGGISEAEAQILGRALEFEPENRYPDCGTFVRELAQACGLPVAETPLPVETPRESRSPSILPSQPTDVASAGAREKQSLGDSGTMLVPPVGASARTALTRDTTPHVSSTTETLSGSVPVPGEHVARGAEWKPRGEDVTPRRPPGRWFRRVTAIVVLLSLLAIGGFGGMCVIESSRLNALFHDHVAQGRFLEADKLVKSPSSWQTLLVNRDRWKSELVDAWCDAVGQAHDRRDHDWQRQFDELKLAYRSEPLVQRLEDLVKALSIGSGTSAEEYLTLAVDEFGAGNFDTALGLTLRGLNLPDQPDRDDPALRRDLGLLYIRCLVRTDQQNDWDRAARQIEELERSSADPFAGNLQRRILWQFLTALTDNHLPAVDVSVSLESLISLAGDRRQAGSDDQANVWTLDAWEKKELANLQARIVQQARDDAEQVPDARENKGVELCRWILKLAPDDHETSTILAELQIRLIQLDEAKRTLQDALARAPAGKRTDLSNRLKDIQDVLVVIDDDSSAAERLESLRSVSLRLGALGEPLLTSLSKASLDLVPPETGDEDSARVAKAAIELLDSVVTSDDALPAASIQACRDGIGKKLEVLVSEDEPDFELIGQLAELSLSGGTGDATSRAYLAESLMARVSATAPPIEADLWRRLNHLLTLGDRNSRAAEPYVQYVRALARASSPESPDWHAAGGEAFRAYGGEPSSTSATLSAPFRKHQAIRILAEAARRLRIPDQRPSSEKVSLDAAASDPFANGNENYAADVWGWLETARGLDSTFAEKQPGLHESLALAAWHKTPPDRRRAGSIAQEVIANTPQTEAVSPSLLYVHANSEGVTPLERFKSFERLLAMIDAPPKDDAQGAVRYYEKLLQPALKVAEPLEPGDAERDRSLARLFVRKGKLLLEHDADWNLDSRAKEALDAYRQALKHHKTANAYTGHARALLKLRQTKEMDGELALKDALQDVNESISLDRGFAAGYAMRGQILLMSSRARRLDDADEQLRLRQADLKESIESCEEAIGLFTKNGEEGVTYANTLVHVSDALVSLANYTIDPTPKRDEHRELLERAEDWADKAADLQSGNVPGLSKEFEVTAHRALGNAREDLAWLAGVDEKWESAVRAFDRADGLSDEMDELNARVLTDAGRCRFKRVTYGRASGNVMIEARDNLADAVELDPNLAEAHYWLARIDRHQQNHQEAEQNLQTGLRLATNQHDDNWVQTCQAELAELAIDRAALAANQPAQRDRFLADARQLSAALPDRQAARIRANVLIVENKHAEAVRVFATVLPNLADADPWHVPLLLDCSHCRVLGRSDFDQAIRESRRAFELAIRPDDRARARTIEAAASVYKSVDPKLARPAQVQLRQLAVERFVQAIELHPTNRSAREWYGELVDTLRGHFRLDFVGRRGDATRLRTDVRDRLSKLKDDATSVSQRQSLEDVIKAVSDLELPQ